MKLRKWEGILPVSKTRFTTILYVNVLSSHITGSQNPIACEKVSYWKVMSTQLKLSYWLVERRTGNVPVILAVVSQSLKRKLKPLVHASMEKASMEATFLLHSGPAITSCWLDPLTGHL